MTIENIKKDSVVLKEMHRNNEIDIVGAIYDTKTGVVEFLDSFSPQNEDAGSLVN